MPRLQKTGPLAGLPLSERPEAPNSKRRRFRNTGSEIISVPPTQAFGLQTWEGQIEVTGYGLEILAGVDGLTTQVGGTTPQTHTVSVTFLIGSETETGGLRGGRTFQVDEIYDGAVLPGRFERIRVRWVGSTSQAPNVPLKLRIFAQPLRVVPVATPRPQGMAVLDFYDGLVFTQAATDLATTLYTDGGTSQPLLHRDANPAIGKGIGGDFRMGPHFSIKRKLVGRVWFPAVVATAQYRVQVEGEGDDGSWYPWAHFLGKDRPDRTASTWDADDVQMVTFGKADGASDDSASTGLGAALWVPAKIRIRSATNTVGESALAGCVFWLSFVGVGG